MEEVNLLNDVSMRLFAISASYSPSWGRVVGGNSIMCRGNNKAIQGNTLSMCCHFDCLFVQQICSKQLWSLKNLLLSGRGDMTFREGQEILQCWQYIWGKKYIWHFSSRRHLGAILIEYVIYQSGGVGSVIDLLEGAGFLKTCCTVVLGERGGELVSTKEWDTKIQIQRQWERQIHLEKPSKSQENLLHSGEVLGGRGGDRWPPRDGRRTRDSAGGGRETTAAHGHSVSE